MTTSIKTTRKHCTVFCPKCGRETSFDMWSDAIDDGREYLSQVLTVILVAFLLWRAETLQEL